MTTRREFLSAWPALLLERPFDGTYGDGHLHDPTQIRGLFPDTTFLGDIRSFNWDGGSDLSSADTGATEGLFIDMSLGSGQWMGDFFIGGDFVMVTGGALKTGTSGQRIEIDQAKAGEFDFFDASNNPLSLLTDNGDLLFFGAGLTGGLSIGGSSTYLIRHASDADTYLSHDGTDQLNLWAGGVEMLRLTESTDDQVFLGNFGSTTVPSLSRIDDPNTGMSLLGSDQIAFPVGGEGMIQFHTDGLRLYDGTNDPALWWGNSTFSAARRYKFYRDDANFDALTLEGTDAAGTTTTKHFIFVDAQVQSPAIRDNTTGSAGSVFINATTGLLQRSTSLLAHKRRVTEKVDYLADINLRPTKHYRSDDKRWRYGLIADWLYDQDPLMGEGDSLADYDTRAVLAVLAAKVNRLEAQLA